MREIGKVPIQWLRLGLPSSKRRLKTGFWLIFKNRWSELSGGKPIVATAHIEEISLAGLREIWNEFGRWRREVAPTFAEEDRPFYKNITQIST